MKVVGQFIFRTRNTGDFVSSPLRYFAFPNAEMLDMRDSNYRADAVIFGGGALGTRLHNHRAHRSAAPIAIAWGVGTSIHRQKSVGTAADWLALYGSREYGQAGAEYVPCASCMSEYFDRSYPVEHEAVVYWNKDPRVGKPAIKGLPNLHNEHPFEQAIAFLGSAETVITNSYHGAYWSQLLGKKVVIVGAYSSKFYHYKFPPAYAEASDWKEAAAQAIAYSEALDDARSNNRDFYERVMSRIADAGE